MISRHWGKHRFLNGINLTVRVLMTIHNGYRKPRHMRKTSSVRAILCKMTDELLKGISAEVGILVGNFRSILHKETGMHCWRPSDYGSSRCWMLNNAVTVSGSKKCSERAAIRERQGSHCESDGGTDKGMAKWFQECFQKPHKCWQKRVTAESSYFEASLIQVMWGCLYLCNKPIPGTFWKPVIVIQSVGPFGWRSGSSQFWSHVPEFSGKSAHFFCSLRYCLYVRHQTKHLLFS